MEAALIATVSVREAWVHIILLSRKAQKRVAYRPPRTSQCGQWPHRPLGYDVLTLRTPLIEPKSSGAVQVVMQPSRPMRLRSLGKVGLKAVTVKMGRSRCRFPCVLPNGCACCVRPRRGVIPNARARSVSRNTLSVCIVMTRSLQCREHTIALGAAFARPSRF